ncbi:hypothetical protein BGZ60DRAFT_499833 [Tricladium varicosporioides]|nr:hypothetical protein BGZ60DRAFT_499833 [Hymenoscyphus varicosporioides]
MGSIEKIQEIDVVIVGAGFGGIWITHKLRERGLDVQCFEKGDSLGGTWYWNCYPGARVDSHYPIYQFSDKELWKDWTWTEKFPGRQEIREYFAYVEEKWNLRRDMRYNTTVSSAVFDESDNKWTLTCEDGSITRCYYFIPALGFAAKRYIPPFKNMENFKGPCFHSSLWPQEGIDLRNKRVAVIGTGASGVQIIQDLSPEVKQMTVYQRTANTPLPMHQEKLTKEFQDKQKADGTYEETLHRIKYKTRGGFDFFALDKRFADETPEQQRVVFEAAWKEGGFAPLAKNYGDLWLNMNCSDALWRFWAEKQGARISDPKKRAIVCPPTPLYAIGAKRAPLEQRYFEAYNYDYVDVIDLNASPILEFTGNGIKSQNEGEIEFDAIILATGFDAITGGLTQIDIKGTDGLTLGERWKDDGIFTNLGMACNKYPNMFFLYGPQGPTAFANGPTCAEIQGEWIDQLIEDMKREGKARVEATREAEVEWAKGTNAIWDMLVIGKHSGNSWYSGANIPGKKRESLNWLGGLPMYIELLKKSRDSGYRGFTLS